MKCVNFIPRKEQTRITPKTLLMPIRYSHAQSEPMQNWFRYSGSKEVILHQPRVGQNFLQPNDFGQFGWQNLMVKIWSDLLGSDKVIPVQVVEQNLVKFRCTCQKIFYNIRFNQIRSFQVENQNLISLAQTVISSYDVTYR